MKNCIFYSWCKTKISDDNDSEVCQSCWTEQGYSGNYPYTEDKIK